jgi:glycosyltransferase involved in cell wall biosynthesis
MTGCPPDISGYWAAMRGSPLVSIIIPTHNDGPVLSQAIDCSLNQTYANREIIVVDDGSTDDTEQLLRREYHGKIKYVRQGNRGAGAARNTGTRMASGKYLQFLDADDLLDPDKIDAQVRQLRDIPDRALSYCDYVRCDIDDITIRYRRTSPVLQTENPYNDIMLRWETKLSIPIHCFLFDASFFGEYGIAFDETLPANEDWECWMNIFALDPKVVFIDRVLAYYRVRTGSRCGNRAKMRRAWVAAIEKQIEKNKRNKVLVQNLVIRKQEMKYEYREASPLMRMMQRWDPAIQNAYERIIPWRIKRLFY